METYNNRYVALSDMLSGISLFPLDNPPDDLCSDFFSYQTIKNAFCFHFTKDTILKTLLDTGCIQQWKDHGYTNLWLEIDNDMLSRNQLTVWTNLDQKEELLLEITIWMEYIHIDRLYESFPALCIEHLRLQLPGKESNILKMPGQDYPSTGMARKIFGIINRWASQIGSLIITEIPQFFHTAYIFSKYFSYIDLEMEDIFQNIQKSLLPNHPTHDDISRLSYKFEEGKVYRNNSQYLWPTEMQAFALSHELSQRLKPAHDNLDTGIYTLSPLD